MLEIGSIAPEFSLPDQHDVMHSLSEHVGEWVVVYFYPKDDTPGCTKEACAIAAVYQEFGRLDVAVYGVSRDSVSSHAKFAAKYGLPFRLLSDEDSSMLNAYGALQEKSMFGNKYLGIVRMTYVIDPNGKIAKVYRKVDPAGHALEMIADIKKLQDEWVG